MKSIKLNDLKKDVQFNGDNYKYLRMILLFSESRNRYGCYEDYFLFVYRSACGLYITRTAQRYDDFPNDFNEPSEPEKVNWSAKLINNRFPAILKKRQEVG